jgi:hypothetical protein
VNLARIIRRLRRSLTPPGNRGSLDTEYRQPNGRTGADDIGLGAPPGGTVGKG